MRLAAVTSVIVICIGILTGSIALVSQPVVARYVSYPVTPSNNRALLHRPFVVPITTTTSTTTTTTQPRRIVQPVVYSPPVAHRAPTAWLACIQGHENASRQPSPYAWGYGPPTYSGDGGGAYQFESGTWALAASLPGALGGAWGSATPAQQDAAALAMHAYDLAHGGNQWAGDGC